MLENTVITYEDEQVPEHVEKMIALREIYDKTLQVTSKYDCIHVVVAAQKIIKAAAEAIAQIEFNAAAKEHEETD